MNVISKHKEKVIEIFNAVTHGFGFVGSLILLIFLFVKAFAVHLSGIEMAGLFFYGATLLLLYLSSTLFHSLVFTKVRRIFQIFDHVNIFLLIAGTYTPFCLIVLHNQKGVWLLFGVWILAIAGIILHIVTHGQHQNIETTIYVGMGWLCMLAGKTLYANLSLVGFWLLVSGGIAFTLGALVYSFPLGQLRHLIWHFFVMIGTTLMFFSIYLNI